MTEQTETNQEASYEEREAAVRNYATAKVASSIATQFLLAKMTGGLSLLITVPTMVVSHVGRSFADLGDNFLFADGYINGLEDKYEIKNRLPDNSTMPIEALKSGATRGSVRHFFAPVIHALIPVTVAADGVGFLGRKMLGILKSLDFTDSDRLHKANNLVETNFDMAFTNSLRDIGQAIGALSPSDSQLDNIRSNSIFSRKKYNQYSYL